MASSGPCYFVIFGATGNLASTKLLPALYELEGAQRLHTDLRFVAFARREWQVEEWLVHLEKVLRERLGDDFRTDIYGRFAERFDFVSGDLRDAAAYTRLMEEISKPRWGTCENMVFYLAIKPSDFSEVIVNLDHAGINRQHGRHRIVVEKPFGEDIESARSLNLLLHKYFDEDQVFRIDHYLGKETVQNLLVFRFANTLIEPIWNRNYIDHVQITAAEDIGIGERAGYYDTAGALRDMLQNHLMQLLTFVAMEPPASIEADALRDEKVKVLRSIRPIPIDAVNAYAVRAQYREGVSRGQAVAGYRDEPGVVTDSVTETYAAAKFYIDNWRWRGVPFYLRTGKRLARETSSIAIRFKPPPQLLFHDTANERISPNWIMLSIQPMECMHMEIHAKRPGLGIQTRIIRLDASYRPHTATSMEAYKTLLLDVIEGDRSLFIRFDEVEWSWQVVDPILRHWMESREYIETYPSGTWGPEEASRLFDHEDHAWRNEI